MERDKLINIVTELQSRLELSLGENPNTKEVGIKIDGFPNEYDVEFIKNNRDEIIDVLKNELSEVEVKIKMLQKDYDNLCKAAREKDISLQEHISRKLKS